MQVTTEDTSRPLQGSYSINFCDTKKIKCLQGKLTACLCFNWRVYGYRKLS